MTAIDLLNVLKTYIEDKLSDMFFPTKFVPSIANNKEVKLKVFIMDMTIDDMKSQAPYILIQFLKSTSSNDSRTGFIRIVVVTYNEDGKEGHLNTLNILERLYIALSKDILIGRKYSTKQPIEYKLFPEDELHYFIGEMNVSFEMPFITREVTLY